MATKIVASLGELCKEVLDSDSNPRMNIQFYIDVKETIEELQTVSSMEQTMPT
jgi:hypothetical protein